MTSVPAPDTFAPMAFRKFARSTICGSFAQFSMIVMPLQKNGSQQNVHRRADGNNVKVHMAALEAAIGPSAQT